MAIWLTADLHVGHVKAPELCGRPFGSTPEEITRMNETIIKYHNELVGREDLVFMLGDICMGKIAETLPLIAKLNGVKVLVYGNHDRPSRLYHHKSEERREEFRQMYAPYFQEMHESLRWEIAGYPVRMTHLPYEDPSYVDHAQPGRYTGQHPIDDGGWLIHGHVHSAWRQKGKQINVGIDAWGLRPTSLVQISRMIKDTENA